MDSPIEYPTLDIPGRGVISVKFGGRAVYLLETELGLDQAALAAKLREFFPHCRFCDGKCSDPAVHEQLPGKVSIALILKILSACTWTQLKMQPEELADCFEPGDYVEVAEVIVKAFSKARWSRRLPPAEATEPEAARPN